MPRSSFLVVDDHVLIRDAMRAVLQELRADCEVREAGTAAEALEALAARTPDLVLLDVNLPDRDGLDLLQEMRRTSPLVPTAMLSSSNDGDTVARSLAQGAVGFIPKSDPRPVLVTALELILAGGRYIPPSVLSTRGPGPAPSATVASLGITGRRLDVLALVMLGKSNKAIARELDLAEPTVKAHVSAVLRALGVATRTEAVLAVTRLGWTLPGR